MKTVWIIGAGRFGRMAVTRLKKKFHLLIVDIDKRKLNAIEGSNLTMEQGNGIQFLADNLRLKTDVDWIVPTLPVHLAWEWCQKKIGINTLSPLIIPDEIDSLLPHPVRGSQSQIYVSHADFICPDNCIEPDHICTYTKKSRKKDMHLLLESLSFREFQPLVIKSRQLAPGIGGYRPSDLFNLSDKIEQIKGKLLICTACRCHGVITGASYQ
ncbi:MAG: potassium transporter [Thermodesulfobacteriota bacterium]